MEPSTNLELPNQAWSSCSSPSSLSPGESDIIECLIVIPEDEPAGSEPVITLVMDGDGIEIRDTKSLLVENAPRLSWNLNTEPIAHEGYPSSYRIEVTNTANTDISHTLDVVAPSSGMPRPWMELSLLSPGESRSIIVEFTLKAVVMARSIELDKCSRYRGFHIRNTR